MTEPKECENNNYCEEGVAQPTPCPDGTITSNDTLLVSASECVPCPTGKYCKGGTIKGDCDDGFFCLAGASDKQPKNEFFEDTILSYRSVCEPGVQCAGYCPPGHFCSL